MITNIYPDNHRCLEASFRFLGTLAAGWSLLLLAPPFTPREFYRVLPAPDTGWFVQSVPVAVFLLALAVFLMMRSTVSHRPAGARWAIAASGVLILGWNARLLWGWGGTPKISLVAFVLEDLHVLVMMWAVLWAAYLLLTLSSGKLNLAGQLLALLPPFYALLVLTARFLEPESIRDPAVPVLAWSLLGMSVAALCVRADVGFMRVLASDTYGGEMARRLAPVAVAVNLAVAWLRYRGEMLGYYEAQLGVALFAVMAIALMTFFSWWLARRLALADLDRRRAEEDALVEAERLHLEIAALRDSTGPGPTGTPGRSSGTAPNR